MLVTDLFLSPTTTKKLEHVFFYPYLSIISFQCIFRNLFIIYDGNFYKNTEWWKAIAICFAAFAIFAVANNDGLSYCFCFILFLFPNICPKK